MTTHERAVEVDTALAALWEAHFDLERGLGFKVDALHRNLGERQERHPRTWQPMPWPTSTEDVVEAHRALAATAPASYPEAYDKDVWAAMEARKLILGYDSAVAAIRANEVAQQPLIAEWLANRWSRFFLVQNAGGHVHSSMSCATCFPTTQYGWLPQLSGLDEAAAVADQGPRLCSVCFPSAPVEWTLGLPKSPKCPGSGQRVERIGRSRYGTCPTCHKSFALSSIGAIRAHKPQEAS